MRMLWATFTSPCAVMVRCLCKYRGCLIFLLSQIRIWQGVVITKIWVARIFYGLARFGDTWVRQDVLVWNIPSKQELWSHKQPAVTRQRPTNNNRVIMFFCAVHADGYTRNSGIRHVISKQQLQWNRNGVFYAVVPGCYKQDQLGVGVKSETVKYGCESHGTRSQE
jgi:hypothetical protein